MIKRKTWPRHEWAPCPSCGAGEGQPCLTSAGKPANRPHTGRFDAARALDPARLERERDEALEAYLAGKRRRAR